MVKTIINLLLFLLLFLAFFIVFAGFLALIYFLSNVRFVVKL